LFVGGLSLKNGYVPDFAHKFIWICLQMVDFVKKLKEDKKRFQKLTKFF